MPVIKPQIKPLLMHITVGIVLACLNCHVCILSVVVFTLVGQLVHNMGMLVCSQQLVVDLLLAIIIITACQTTSDGSGSR